MDFIKTFIGSIIFTAAVLLFINFAGDVLVGQEPHKEAPAPEATATVTAPEPVKAAPVVVAPTVMASSGNAEIGAKTFRKKCLGCHPVSDDGKNRTGPNLFGIVGSNKASAEGYRYSTGLKKLGGTWTEKEINTFIAGPRVMVPKTKMTFSGVKKENQRNDIVAYLKLLSK
ncbi:MAG: cytochrome c family protein [Rhodospirillaceae bacterium]|nr:cytochrome c family protein [Rhodospirillaceae bacterium]